MSLREIKYFIAIAEELNLSKAAKKLYVSQPSLSTFLAKLESEFNTQFFFRAKNNSLTLTTAGKIFIDGCKKIIEIYENMESEIYDLSNSYNTVIKLGVIDERFNFIALKSIQKLKALYPNISVQIEMYSAHELVDRVLNDKLDIAHSAYIEKNPGLNYVQLTDVEVDLVAKDTSPLAKYSIQPGREECRISLKEVEGEPMIMLPPSTVLRKVEENYFKKIDFKPNTAFMVNTHYSLLAMVAQKDILSLSPRTYKSNKVVRIALDPPMRYISGLFYKKAKYIPQPVKDFIKILKEASDSQNTFEI